MKIYLLISFFLNKNEHLFFIKLLFQVKNVFMVSLPFILFWSVGMILQIQVDYLIKLGLFVVIYVYTNVVSEFVFDDRLFRYFL